MTEIFKIAIVLCGLAAGCWGKNCLMFTRRAGRSGPPLRPTDFTCRHAGRCKKNSDRPDRYGRRSLWFSELESNEARLETREVRLTKWDSYLFTQGVVIFAFEDLMPTKDRMAMIRRAINWADASVDIGVIAK